MPTWWTNMFIGTATPAPATTSPSGLGGNGANGYMQYQPRGYQQIQLSSQQSLSHADASSALNRLYAESLLYQSFEDILFNSFYERGKPPSKMKRHASPSRPLKGL